jgi:hypothetical protein
MDRDKLITETSKSVYPDSLLELSDKKQEEVLDVFEYWNSFKGQGKWWAHRKLTPEIIKAIFENLKEYSVEEICGAIDNYSKVLIDEKYFWEYPWPLHIFLTVKYEKVKNGTKKWWQFLENNFIEENYLKEKNEKVISNLVSPDENLTNEIIFKYIQLINNKDGFELTAERKEKFVKTTECMIKFFEKKSITRKNWVYYLMQVLEKEYTNKGESVCVGHLCSDHLWQVLIPQYITRELGVE